MRCCSSAASTTCSARYGAAGADGKQLAVVLSLPDCPGCLEMEKTVYRDTHTQRAIERRFRTVHLDLARTEPIIDARGGPRPPLIWRRRLRAVRHAIVRLFCR
jgi:thioredoxin-related protein